MNYEQLFEQIRKKKSFLCIGLDTDKMKIPQHLWDNGDEIFTFNKEIVDATHHLCIAYKPNLAFYESQGLQGWQALDKTARYIKENYPDIFLIADAKRGDIGNTSKMYAQAFFTNMPFDAITVAPYMGEDSVAPFLEYPDKWAILLALTSNKGSQDFQFRKNPNGYPMFWDVLSISETWGTCNTMMYVVGATKADQLTTIRRFVPNHFLLVPGVGAQGGSLQEVATYGMNHHCGLIVNSSREIIYAGKDEHFAEAAANIAHEKYQQPMAMFLRDKRLL
ncbi:MAG: orotidine-5'-phosphate decarboxylase [bacterium]